MFGLLCEPYAGRALSLAFSIHLPPLCYQEQTSVRVDR